MIKQSEEWTDECQTLVCGVLAGVLVLRYPRRHVAPACEGGGQGGGGGEMPWPTAVFVRQLPLP